MKKGSVMQTLVSLMLLPCGMGSLMAERKYPIPSDTTSEQALVEKIAKLKKDPHRPRYHFLPAAGEWINDTHPFYWKGVYHIFYQYEPTRNWGRRQMGHVRSRDLVNWEELPIALAPGPQAFDAGSIYSGSVFAGRDGRVHFIYDTVPSTDMGHAVANDDDLIHWTKDPAPLCSRPAGLRGQDAPEVMVTQEGYRIWLGSWEPGGVSDYILFRAPAEDMAQWTRVGSFFRTQPGLFLAALPQFFYYQDKAVFCYTEHQTYRQFIHVGRVENDVFHSEHECLYDGSPRAFNSAGKSLIDDHGRRIFITWVLEDRYNSPAMNNTDMGWAGCLSLPRIFRVGDDGAVLLEPVPEVESLREQHSVFPAMPVGGGPEGSTAGHQEIRLVQGLQGDELEIIAKFQPMTARRFGLVVRCAPDLSEMTVIEVDTSQRKLRLDSRRASLACHPAVNPSVLEADWPAMKETDGVELRVFVDHSVIEVYADGNRARITGRVYPTRSDSQGVGLWATNGEVECSQLAAWQMRAIY